MKKLTLTEMSSIEGSGMREMINGFCTGAGAGGVAMAVVGLSLTGWGVVFATAIAGGCATYAIENR